MNIDEFIVHFKKKYRELDRRRNRLSLPPNTTENGIKPDQWHYTSTVVGLTKKQYFRMIKKQEKL